MNIREFEDILIQLFQLSIMFFQLDNYLPNIPDYLQNFSTQLIEFFSLFFPISLNIAFIIANISLISGAILYLMEYNEEPAKMMILRSFIILLLIISIFNPVLSDSSSAIEPFKGFHSLASFITSYLLFIFAALSLIVFLGNLGLYLIESDAKRKRNLKKSFFCLICIVLPLGFQFPNMPLWEM